jgi:hypothetical protein
MERGGSLSRWREWVLCGDTDMNGGRAPEAQDSVQEGGGAAAGGTGRLAWFRNW